MSKASSDKAEQAASAVAAFSSLRRLLPIGRPRAKNISAPEPLRSAYERNATLAERFAWLILLGLAIEIAEVFILQRPFWEALLSVSASAAIAMGVWGEIVFEGRAREAGDGIVAEANARALEAQLALEKYRAHRHLSEEQWRRITSKIAQFGPRQCDFAVNNADPEAQRMANALYHHLTTLAGWRPISWRQPGVMVLQWNMPGFPDWGINTMTIGVQIQVTPRDRDSLGPVAAALAEALNAEGIETEAELGIASHSMNAKTIHILVGKKP